MNIVMVGSGYVGLVTGACFAQFGHHVTCVDIDAGKIARLTQGMMPIYEPGLDALVKKNVTEKRLYFTTDMAQAVPDADAVFIAVGTPTSRRGDGYADLQYVYDAAKNIAPHLRGYTVVVDKSTVPVGTAAEVKRRIMEIAPDADVDVASNPEFLREGNAIKDFTHPDRIVIGVDSERAQDVLHHIYKPINLTEVPFVVTDIKSAELSKYGSNGFLAVKISFANEMARLCDEIGANVVDVMRAMGMDKRIGRYFLHPGPGYGGSCFPKDTKAIRVTAEEHGVTLSVIGAAIEANNAQKAYMIKKICTALGKNLAGKKIAVLGLAFKPETDDMRDAPALTIIPALVEKGAHVRVHDPQAMDEAKKSLADDVTYCDSAYDACHDVDMVVLLTEWNQYRALDWQRIHACMGVDHPVFVDLRNVYVPDDVRKYGFAYVGVGRN